MSCKEDCRSLDRALKEYLFIPHSAVAVRLLDSRELAARPSWLSDFRRAGRGMPEKVLTCQTMAMVRIYGWPVLLEPRDLDCPTGLLTLGWIGMSPEYRQGLIPVTPYNQTQEARARRMEAVPMLELGKYAALAAAPLGECPFEPTTVVVYGTPAQTIRLVHAALFEDGGVVKSAASGAQGCSQYLTQVLLSQSPRYILPGNGDRIFGHVEEHQMAFSLPGADIGRMAQGLKLSHEGGQVYPIQNYVKAGLNLPGAYTRATEHLRAQAQGPARG